jgi:DMSO/TMAO reductase YedYZ molybdopterin-dependent catalytic subunit
MSIRIRTPSPFLARKSVDRIALKQTRTLVEDFNRRRVLRGALTLGALTVLTGCDVSEVESVQQGLRAVSSWNDAVQAAIFRPDHLAPTFSPSQAVNPPRYNAHIWIDEVKPIDGATWKLELAGLIKDKRPWTSQQIYQLPEQESPTRLICVEGWDYIGHWSGPNLRAFLTRIGADLAANYIYFICNDDFTESIDMASALHPQTILTTKYAGAPIGDPFGYPLRLRTPVKLGYKNVKWIRAIEVTNTFRPTFWSKQGENWFAGV